MMTLEQTTVDAAEAPRKTIHQFITDTRITMTAVRVDRNPNMDNPDMDHWKCKLWFVGQKRTGMTTYFSMGVGHNGAEPTAPEVLSCLASDAAGIEQDFESWASDLGYDTDSRKAERTYQACQRLSEKLKRFLGDGLFQELVYNTEGL